MVLRHPHELATVEKLVKVEIPPGDTLSELISMDVLCHGHPLLHLQVSFRFLRAQHRNCGADVRLVPWNVGYGPSMACWPTTHIVRCVISTVLVGCA